MPCGNHHVPREENFRPSARPFRSGPLVDTRGRDLPNARMHYSLLVLPEKQAFEVCLVTFPVAACVSETDERFDRKTESY